MRFTNFLNQKTKEFEQFNQKKYFLTKTVETETGVFGSKASKLPNCHSFNFHRRSETRHQQKI